MAIGDNEKKVKFTAEDGISPFMKKLVADQNKLYDGFAAAAKKQTDNQKEQLKIIEQQIKALERRSKLEKELTSQKIAQMRQFGGEKEQDAAADLEYQMKIDRSKDRLRFGGLRESLIRDRESIPAERKEAAQPKEGVFSSVLLAGLVRDIFGMLRQTSSAQSGLDFLSPVTSIMGGIAGGLTGAAADALNINILGTGFGKANLGILGAQAGKDIGGLAGDLVTRQVKTEDQYIQAINKFRALGGTGGAQDLSSMGFDYVQTSDMMAQAARARGRSTGAAGTAASVLGLSRGFGIDEGVSLQALGMERAGSTSGGVQNMRKTLGLAIAEGLDRARFTDAIQSQTAIMQKFAETSTKVDINDVNRTMFEFNRLGGAFGVGDPRAMGKMSSISGALSNPDTGVGQAMSYQVLSEMMPGADPWEIVKAQEKGVFGPRGTEYLGGMIGKVKGMGVPPMLQKFLLSGMLKRGSVVSEDIEGLLDRGPSAFGSLGDIKEVGIGNREIMAEGEKLTSSMQRDMAQVTNAFTRGIMDGIITLENQFESRFKDAINNVVQYYEDKMLKADDKPDPKVTVGKIPLSKRPNTGPYEF